jgi:hypothetical protein
MNLMGEHVDTSRFMKLQLAWLIGSLAISIGLSFILPFPLSIIVAITIFISVSLTIRYRMMKGMGVKGRSFGLSLDNGPSKLKATCIGCGHKHNKRACPKCGNLGVTYH